jgi:hypothetical protein
VSWRSSNRLSGVALVAAALVLSSTLIAAGPTAGAVPRQAGPRDVTYPIGVFDESEPSGFAPPPGWAIPGYQRTYVNDFNRPLDPSLWAKFSGVPGGDPAGLFQRSHVKEFGGELKIETYRDHNDNNRWATGGICLCGLKTTYGAFFVRSRETHAGPDDVELLWPYAPNIWPPELDFDEMGVADNSSSWTDHYTSPSQFVQQSTTIDVLHWHTWGVVWTPTSVTFVVDGRVWGVITDPTEIPSIPMTLDMQQQTWCGIHPECPTRTSAMLIDWVAIFTPTH